MGMLISPEMAARSMLRALGETSADPPANGEDSLTFDKLLQAVNEVKALSPRPMVTAVWCVDRPALVDELRELCCFGRRQESPGGKMLPLVGILAGIPFHEVNRATLTLADRLRLPGCASVPGVWLVMTDGTVTRMEEGDGRVPDHT